MLCDAIRATFARRRTAIPNETPLALSPLFAQDSRKLMQWRAFLSKSKLDAGSAGLREVVDTLGQFLLPTVVAIKQEKPFAMLWPSGGPWSEIGAR